MCLNDMCSRLRDDTCTNKGLVFVPGLLTLSISCIHAFSKSEPLNWDWTTHDLSSYFKLDFISKIMSHPITLQRSQSLTVWLPWFHFPCFFWYSNRLITELKLKKKWFWQLRGLAYHNWEWWTIHDYWKYGSSEATEEFPGNAMEGKKGHKNNNRENREYWDEEAKNLKLFLLGCKCDEDQDVYDFNPCSSAIHCWY